MAVFNSRIVSVHVHDNRGQKDEHLWPGDGTIEWPVVREGLQGLKTPPAAVLEIMQNLGDAPNAIPERIQRGFERLG